MTLQKTDIHRFEVPDPHHGAVPCAAILPRDAARSLPCCLFLYGGGGSHQTLIDIEPLLASWWASGALPPMVVATPDVGPWSFYLDDPARGLCWESFVTDRFVPHLTARFVLSPAGLGRGLVGVSMGGYGALKIAFSRAPDFAAVAAVSPMVEPARTADRVPLRNRFHYPAEVPAALLGQTRDEALYERDHPASRARAHAAQLQRNALAVYIDAAGRDALHAHDGAEYVHRTLWQLDIAHEYRLRRDSDHIGPGFIERLREAFVWVGRHIAPAPVVDMTPAERAWLSWMESGCSTVAPSSALPPESPLLPRLLRAQLASRSRPAAAQDPTMHRVYGVLPNDT